MAVNAAKQEASGCPWMHTGWALTLCPAPDCCAPFAERQAWRRCRAGQGCWEKSHAEADVLTAAAAALCRQHALCAQHASKHRPLDAHRELQHSQAQSSQGEWTALEVDEHLLVRGPAREQHAAEERLDVLQLCVRCRPLQGLCCAELGVQRLRLDTGTK